jgi:hypothetical protein
VCQKVARLRVFDLIRCSVKVAVGVVQSRGQGLGIFRAIETCGAGKNDNMM